VPNVALAVVDVSFDAIKDPRSARFHELPTSFVPAAETWMGCATSPVG